MKSGNLKFFSCKNRSNSSSIASSCRLPWEYKPRPRSASCIHPAPPKSPGDCTRTPPLRCPSLHGPGPSCPYSFLRDSITISKNQLGPRTPMNASPGPRQVSKLRTARSETQSYFPTCRIPEAENRPSILQSTASFQLTAI
ncbi:hypothetical protein HWI79_291 [Cryptosporidium felis]|nr:hypothetical protein HWI79_291 [Cryptosporidium felis]